MNLKYRGRHLRRALGAASAAALATAAPAALAGPVVDVGQVPWTAISGQAGPFATGDGGVTISSAAGATIPAGSHLQTQYCTQFGPNTRLTGATVRRVRWHATANDILAYMRIQDPAGTDRFTRYLYNNATSGEMAQGTAYEDAVDFTPGQCFYGGVYANGTTNAPGWGSLMTNLITNVKVEDLQGPAVSGSRTYPGTWFTGDQAVVWWTQTDNAFLRGNTYASITGGGTVDLGDQGDGEVGAWVSVGALADGSHQICGTRNASSPAYWAAARDCTAFLLDRTNPAAPTIGLSPDTGGAWTNANVTVTTAATGDGTGSGWSRNQFARDGGAWYDSTPSFVRSSEGAVTITARAVDVAGRVSAASAGRLIRIDKTAPVAEVAIAGQTVPGLVDLSKGATGDALSGLKGFQVRLGAPDGPIVATSDAELLGIGASGPAKDAGAVRLHLIAEDNAGNTAAAVTPTLRLDSVAPSASMQQAPAGWIKDFDVTGPVDNRLSVTLTDNTADGLGPVQVQIRQGAGAWADMATFNQPGFPDLSQGTHLLNPSVAGLGLVDGPAEVRVVAHDPTFPALASATLPQTVRIDATSPAATDLGGWGAAPTGTPGRYRVTLPTLADATSGLTRVEVLVHTSPAGLQDDTGFVVAGSVSEPTGTVAVVADVAGMAAGIHATRIRATDRAGNVLLTSGPVISLDTTLPSVSVPTITPSGLISFTLLDAGGFGACPARIEISGPGTNAAWQTIFEQAAGTLPPSFSYQLPLSGMANGDYRVRTTVCDAAGNSAVHTGIFAWTGGPVGAVGGVPQSFVATALTADGQAGTRLVNGKVLPVIRRVYNRPFVLRGHLQKPDGTAMAGTGIELRDSAGRYVTGRRTDAAGNFAVAARASVGGVWTINVVGQPGRDAAALLEVKPIVAVRMRFVRVGAARRLVATGRMQPSAGSFNKAVQLQWRDGSGRWRPALNGRVAKNGTFRMKYQFRRPGGYTVRFRVAVPADTGWPYLPTASRTLTLRVP